jgi:cytidylate kinase
MLNCQYHAQTLCLLEYIEVSSIKIIGLSGTNGAGKGVVGHTLALKHNFLFVSVSDLLREECKMRNLPITRENLRTISAEWRKNYGLGVLVDMGIKQFEKLDNYSGVAIDSIRNPHEVDRIHELGGIVVWVDANAHTRFERIQRNLAERGRSTEDQRSFEQFLADEEAEMHPKTKGDETALNMAGVKTKSDIFLLNDNTNLEQFEVFIDQQLFGSAR